MDHTELQRAWAKKKSKEIQTSPEAQKILVRELGEEFGRRVGLAVREGIPPLVAFEAVRENYRITGGMMIKIADEVSFEMINSK